MNTPGLLYRLATVLLLVSLLISTAAPAVQAQDDDPGYPQHDTSDVATLDSDLLYRVHITVSGAARWQRLERLGVAVLSRDDAGATVLVD
ncbi:MAG TPA: hypothetical protein ENJ35_08425, partial [Gammaproteobacteria bacterium]|nr:hypothetical protein [Gammaproteobacteria bacterium]